MLSHFFRFYRSSRLVAAEDKKVRSVWSAPVAELDRVIRLAIGVAAVALIITPFAGISVGSSSTFLAMILSAAIMGTAVTALLLILQARSMQSAPTAVLGAGFAYASATMIPYTILYPPFFPELTSATGVQPAAHEYLWFFWQAGLLFAILAYQRMRYAESRNVTTRVSGKSVIVILAVAFAILTPLAIWVPGLPETFSEGHWTPVFSTIMVPLVVILAGLAIFEALRRRRRASLLDAWIAVVAFAVIIEAYLMIVGAGRFTIGWYASRILILVATSIVLSVLLAQAARLYAELIDRAEVLESEAHTDTLTGLPNRRRFDEEFARAFGSAIRRASPIAVAIIDIDRFKQYNDTFGHQAGDAALQKIAAAMAESVARSNDFAARYGGEEFVVILEDTTLGGAAAVAERIRTAVLDTNIPSPAGTPLTVSVGVAARLPGSSREALLRQADAALYEAKKNGRNRVQRWHSSQLAPIGSAFDDPQLSE
jgi:diguanylate cyclase (GGDEF)-like protein